MGGCCCCSSRAAELNTAPTYYLYPRALEEHVPLSSHHATASGLSTLLLVDTDLDTSTPDAYRPPPTPMPFDVDRGRPPTPRGAEIVCGHKNDGSAETEILSSVQEAVGGNARDMSVKCEDVKEVDCKAQTDFQVDSTKGVDVELSKSVGLFVPEIEEEDCPICLEEYDAENPKITTKCEHHFHLACILEWMERSEACPVCDKEMIFDPPVD